MWPPDRAWVPGLILGPGPSLNFRLGPPGARKTRVQFWSEAIGAVPHPGSDGLAHPNDGQIEAEVRDR